MRVGSYVSDDVNAHASERCLLGPLVSFGTPARLLRLYNMTSLPEKTHHKATYCAITRISHQKTWACRIPLCSYGTRPSVWPTATDRKWKPLGSLPENRRILSFLPGFSSRDARAIAHQATPGAGGALGSPEGGPGNIRAAFSISPESRGLAEHCAQTD